MKIGFAKDIHELVSADNQRSLILGGYHIQGSEYIIKATSDGDIVLHAITSALLGALEMRTLGEYFPDTEKINFKRNSVDFISFALKAMSTNGYYIESIDLCIVCEQVMLSKYLPFIKESLLKILGIKGLGIKCTRFEDSENKMIECYATLILNEN